MTVLFPDSHPMHENLGMRLLPQQKQQTNKQTNKQTTSFVQLFCFRLQRQECLEEPPKLLSQGYQGSRHIRPPPLPSPSPPAATASDDVHSRLGKESSLEVVQQPW